MTKVLSYKSKIEYAIDVAMTTDPAIDIGKLMRWITIEHGAINDKELTYLLNWKPKPMVAKRDKVAPLGVKMAPTGSEMHLADYGFSAL